MPRGRYPRVNANAPAGFIPFMDGRAVGHVVDAPKGCWNFVGKVNYKGYGQIHFGAGRSGAKFAHRVYYERAKGPIPEGLQLDHLCRNRQCVNPDHLEPVTLKQNQERGSWATKTHCPQGHPYEGDNLVVWKGRRQCRECGRNHKRNYKAKKRATRKTGSKGRKTPV